MRFKWFKLIKHFQKSGLFYLFILFSVYRTSNKTKTTLKLQGMEQLAHIHKARSEEHYILMLENCCLT